MKTMSNYFVAGLALYLGSETAKWIIKNREKIVKKGEQLFNKINEKQKYIYE